MYSCNGGRIYKGEDIEITIPFNASGFTSFSASFYTNSTAKIIRNAAEVEFGEGVVVVDFDNTDLDILPDGVLRYTFNYKIGLVDYVQSSNTPFYLKTPKDYSAITPTEIYQSGYTAGVNYQKSLLVSTAITENGTYTRENGYNEIVVNVPVPQSDNSQAIQE